MAKPICLVTIDSGERKDAWELCADLREVYESRMPDYHIFVIPNFISEGPIPAMHLQVFYEKDFTEIQYEELKAMIENSIKEFKVNE
jgi:hypothetical protein